jgi:hypothetical protein
MAVFFDGRLIESPTTASVVNDDAMLNQNLSVGNIVALVGRSAGGKPKTALRFGSPNQAKAALVSGELLDAVLAAFSPSPQTGGPATVVAVRVQPATQATGVIKDASDATVINLTSTDYGVRENMVGWKVEAGTTTGLRLTTQRGTAYYTQDNIARNAFSVVYTGGQSTATITISGTSAVLAAPAGTTVATLLFSDFTTVQDVVDRINLVSGFAATVEDDSYTAPTASGLDFVTAQSVKTTAYTVTADLQAVVDWLNSASEGFVTATRAAGAGTKPVAAALQFLSGATDGLTTNDDWSLAFEALQTVDVQWITPVSSDAAIHAMTDVHCDYMSSVMAKKRRAICGTALATSDAAAIAAAKAINSDRTSLVHLGHYNYNAAGKSTLYPPYITAALLSGMFSGVNPGTALTNKAIRCIGLERDLRNPTDTDPLIRGGVLCLENTDQGYKVVKSISTWLINKNYNRVEQSCGCALDFADRNVVQAVDVLRGEKQNPLLLRRAISITESTLRELAREEPNGPGVLAGDANSPAYRNITASIDGDVLRISYECSPVIPNNYILVTVYARPFSGSATA